MKNYVDELPRVDMKDVTFSKHALQRALDMGVEGHDITAALTKPEYGYWSRKHSGWCATSGRVSVAFRADVEDEGRWVVLTTLWATEEAWEDDAAKAPLPDGRELKRGWMR